MIRCYHARKGSDNEIVAPLIATIDSNEEHLEDLWDCCNNSCWWGGDEDFAKMTNYKGKFNVEFTPEYRGYCNDDLIVEMQGQFYVSKSFGWDSCASFESALDYCKKNSFWCRH